MKLIKKSEKLLLDQIKSMELEDENLQTEITNEPEPLVEERRVIDIENQVPDYIPVRDNPIVHSVGNTGWQVSEIWKEIRLDSFCNS